MLFCNFTPRKCPFAILFFILFLLPSPGTGSPNKNLFPLLPAIKTNVSFWEKIYSTYSTNTAVIHDKNDLTKIYETIPLLDRNLPGASRVNRTYLKRVKKNYSDILKSLARGKTPSTLTEKRVLRMFSPIERRKKLKIASENIRVQTGLKERFRDGVIRSGGYLKEMKKIFRSYNIPEDLAYLPHVESSFNIKAYSKFGAAGIWQFTRSTGKGFMTIDYIVDERRDPLIATHAAAKYLKQNFETLGSWPLAITAYNYGHSGMRRAAQEQGTYEKIFLYYNKGHFKFASRNFYSEFVAALNVAKQMETTLSLQLERPKKRFLFKLRGYAHINDISHYFNLPTSTIQEFNPSLRTPVWQGEKYIPHEFLLQLPHNQETIRLARLFPTGLLYKDQKRSQFYKVKRGDTAGRIANIHKVSLRSLSNANNLNSNAVVYIGQTLRIPSSSKKGSSNLTSRKTPNSAKKSESTYVTLSGNKKIAPSWKIVDSKEITSAYDFTVQSSIVKNGIVHGKITVQPEESIGIYAEWLKISKQKLLRLSNISTEESIHPGQKIALPFINTTQQLFENLRQDFHQETQEDFFNSYKITGFKQYQVAQGDTLWDICQNKFDLPLWLLKKYNTNLNYNKIDFRQLLKIPIIESL